MIGPMAAVAVIGAGAMGAALGMHVARSNPDTVLLATEWDGAVFDAWRAGAVHPALGLAHPTLRCRPHREWEHDLGEAEIVIVAVSTEGLRRTLAEAVPGGRRDSVWVIATKGWQPGTLESPCEIASALLGDERVVALAGPGLAAEIAVGAPTALVCAGRARWAAQRAAEVFRGHAVSTVVTDDVVGAETGAAFKNVVAIAVGMCEGFADRLVERASANAFANARAAVFALGMIDMVRLAERSGGRADTVLGLAGAGDLYVTCLGGRNGRFGRLLGAGQTAEQAATAIGSTVEGVANCAAALALARRESIDLPTARAVEAALARGVSGTDAAEEFLRIVMSGLAASTSVLGR